MPDLPKLKVTASNLFMVSMAGNDLTVLKRLPVALSKHEALNLAAYLVAMADDHEEFDELLDRVTSGN